MSRGDALSSRQLGLLTWTAMLSPLVRQFPAAALSAAGSAAWLSALLTVPALLLLPAALGPLLRARREGEGLPAVFCRALGNVPGRLLCALCAFWLCFSAGFSARSGADRFVAAVYPESPVWLFAGGTLLLCLPAALGRTKVLGLCAEAAFPALLGVLALLLLPAVPELDLPELRPAGAGALLRTAAGAPPLLGTVSAGVFFALLPVREGSGGRAALARALPLLALLGAALSAAVVATFGPALAARMDYPFFVMIRNVRLLHLLERVEALAAGTWVVTDFLLLGAQLQMAAVTLAAALRGPAGERTAAVSLPCAALAALSAWLCAPDAFALQALGRTVMPAVHFFFAFGVLPLVGLVGKCRKTI